MLSPSVSRRKDTSGTQLSFSVDCSVGSRPASFAWTVISSAPPGTSMRSSRSICESAVAGSLSSVSRRFGPWALLIVGNSGEITSRTARKKLALRCQCLRLWVIILGQHSKFLADGEFMLHVKANVLNDSSTKTSESAFRQQEPCPCGRDTEYTPP